MDAFTSIDELRRSLIVCAQSDALHEPDATLRQYSWNPGWAEGVGLASYDSGGGDTLRTFLGDDFGLVVGFDHESRYSPWNQEPAAVLPGMFTGMPGALRRLFDDDWNSTRSEEWRDLVPVTFCYWRPSGSDHWRHGPVSRPAGAQETDDGGQGWLADTLPHTVADYLDRWQPVPAEVEQGVHAIFRRAELPPVDLERYVVPIRARAPTWADRGFRWLDRRFPGG